MGMDVAMTVSRFRRHGAPLARFGAVGVFNVLTEFGVFALLVHFGAHLLAANTVGFLCANIQSYIVNSHVTFRNGGAPAKLSFHAYGRFLAAHLLSLAISSAFILVFSSHIGPFAAKGAAVLFGFVANYTMSSLFVFRDHKPHKGGSESQD